MPTLFSYDAVDKRRRPQGVYNADGLRRSRAASVFECRLDLDQLGARGDQRELVRIYRISQE